MSRAGQLALLIGFAAVTLIGFGALVGLGLAGLVFGGGWVWPPTRAALNHTLGGLLAGHPGRGLPPSLARRIPGPHLAYLGVAVAELVVLVAAIGIGRVVARYVRPGDARGGMASRAEAAAALGVRPLRRAKAIIRPDLYARASGRTSSRGARGAVTSFGPATVGWRLGRSETPRGVALWVRYDRTTGVYGEQGSGKTLDVLAPALLGHDGPGLATLTKVDDLLLTAGRRAAGGRPISVLDPFGAAPGLPELVWDPLAGCVDPKIAEKRAKAFAAGTVTGAVTGGRQDSAARFYAAETAKVLKAFFHAAALTGRSLDHVLDWVANPVAADKPAEILQQHPHAARFWDGLLAGALHGAPDTVGNTVTTVQQAMELFFQPDIRTRCLPGPGRTATDLAELIRRRGTVYLLGRDDPYASAAPLMTAVAEHVLDTALGLAAAARHGRLTPSFLACLDELPSTTPLPTLRVRMANERAVGLSFIYAAQTWKQMVVSYGDDEARSLFGLSNNLIIFGGGKDIHFYREISDLIDEVRISRQTVTDGPGGFGTTRSAEDVRVLRPGDIRRLRDGRALVVAGNAPPIIARLHRCIDGPDGQMLLQELTQARAAIRQARRRSPDLGARTRAAVGYARDHYLHAPDSPAGTGHGPEGAP
jgi:type IV secretory pathway TraG/TraD family ATPase VirD4